MEAFICGGAAAIVSITCTHPIDVVKTRLQVQGELQAARAPGSSTGPYSGPPQPPLPRSGGGGHATMSAQFITTRTPQGYSTR